MDAEAAKTLLSRLFWTTPRDLSRENAKNGGPVVAK